MFQHQVIFCFRDEKDEKLDKKINTFLLTGDNFKLKMVLNAFKAL